ncbi:peroxiredoxin [Bifidobacterium gallicum]|nr:peroxiredoxin [Bifidobacterium gallicum]KFI58677.1 bacterioferritin comigratory protein [Bifidobacterium gallicum DSM 20093 = LMG 11596]
MTNNTIAGEKPSFEHPVHLKAGESAPNFELESDEYKHYALADFKHQNVVLFFYPQAMSSLCTIEAKGFRDNMEKLNNLGYTVIGVSGDGVDKLQEFREKYNLNFTLLSDPTYEVHKLYGTVTETHEDGKKQFHTVRSTFAIGKDGKIELAEYDVKVDNHINELIRDIEKVER